MATNPNPTTSIHSALSCEKITVHPGSFTNGRATVVRAEAAGVIELVEHDGTTGPTQAVSGGDILPCQAIGTGASTTVDVVGYFH